MTNDTNSSTGYINGISSSTVYKVGPYTNTGLKYITSGSLIKFTAPTGYYFDTTDSNTLVLGDATPAGAVTSIWAEVVSVVNDGTGVSNSGVTAVGFGAITLNTEVPTSAVVSQVIPKWRTVIDSTVITTMVDLIFANKPFDIRRFQSRRRQMPHAG